MTQRTNRANDNRQARTMALQVLFENDYSHHSLDEILQRYIEDIAFPPAVREYTSALIKGVAEHREEIDAEIVKFAPAFPLDQLAAIDRNILRLAIYELHYRSDVPPKAAMNEAVELAKEFGGDGSSRFVNGVLGSISRQQKRNTTVSDV